MYIYMYVYVAYPCQRPLPEPCAPQPPRARMPRAAPPPSPSARKSCLLHLRAPPRRPALNTGSNCVFQFRDLCWSSVKSGDVW